MPQITPFINLCSYIAMFSLAIMIFLIFLFRLYRIQGKNYRAVAFFLIVFTVLFLVATILVGILYR